MNQEDAYSLAPAILLIGGILAIAFGATSLGTPFTDHPTLSAALADTTPILTVMVGVVALVASGRVKDEAIDIVLAVLGFLAGGWLIAGWYENTNPIVRTIASPTMSNRTRT